MSSPYEPSDDMPVYVISVAAQLSGMHPQTLRAYEKLGLVTPGRRQGSQGSLGKGHRRYSMRDILALREIQRLSQEEGVNLNGIKLLLEQLRELEQARTLIAELHAELAQLRVELESTRAVAARLAELRRSGSDTRSGRQGLVPVRSARVAVWEPMTGPSSEPGPPRGDK
jgi:MerR family transcriptional regulator, heat shock protein HspR